MENYSNYYIKDKLEPNKIICFTDQDPKGVTITIKEQNEGGGQRSFTLCRRDMIEALEYVVKKLKSTLSDPL